MKAMAIWMVSLLMIAINSEISVEDLHQLYNWKKETIVLNSK